MANDEPEPTPQQKERYKELRKSGKSPMEAKRIALAEEPADKKR